MALIKEFKTQGDFLFRYRSFIPLIILVLGLLIYLQSKHEAIEGTRNWLPEFYNFICLGVSFIGFFIRVKTIGHAGRNTSGKYTHEGQVAEELNTTGLYSTVRHPLYLGNYFMWLGVAMLTQNVWFMVAFTLFYYLYYERIMYAEEHFLTGKFKEQYSNWANITPAFIPSFKNYKKSVHAFDFIKVLRMEKNGFAAIFLVFWLFRYTGDLVLNGTYNPERNFWFYAMIASLFIYLVLKILKKRKLLESRL